MRSRMRNSFEFLSVSALDLFASALGVFILITFVLLPFYLRQPSLEAEVRGAAADVAAVAHQLDLVRRQLTTAEGARQEAEAARLAAGRRLAAAQEAAQRAAAEPKPAAARPSPRPATLAIPPLDLVIALDTTGSMRDELRDLQASLLGIVRVLHRLSPSLALGIVAYKDHGQTYVTRTVPLGRVEGRSLDEAIGFVDGLRAEGGGDTPEAVDAALAEAVAMPWRHDEEGGEDGGDRVRRRLLVIGDAPARPVAAERAYELAARFRAAGGRVTTVFTGSSEGGRVFFERLAAAGGGDVRRHGGEMMESVLLSVLDDDAGTGEAPADAPPGP